MSLVEKVNAFVVRSDVLPTLQDLQKNNNGLTQFHDLIRAAEQSEFNEEFVLYIQYKAAKAQNGEWWKKLAKPLTDWIRELDHKDLKTAMGYLMWNAYAIARGVKDVR
jgi:hypothetical protein